MDRRYRSQNHHGRQTSGSQSSERGLINSRSPSVSSNDSDRVFMGPGPHNVFTQLSHPRGSRDLITLPTRSVDNRGYDSHSSLFGTISSAHTGSTLQPSENPYETSVNNGGTDQNPYSALGGGFINKSVKNGGLGTLSVKSDADSQSQIYNTIDDIVLPENGTAHRDIKLPDHSSKQDDGKRSMRCVIISLVVCTLLVIIVIGAAVGIGIYMASGDASGKEPIVAPQTGDDCLKHDAGTWGAWMNTSPCSVTYGTGVMQQERACLCQPCHGDISTQTECSVSSCPQGSETTPTASSGHSSSTTTTTTSTTTTTATSTTTTTAPPRVVSGPIDMLILDDDNALTDAERNMAVQLFDVVIKSLVIGESNVKIAYHNLPGPYGWSFSSPLATAYNTADGIFYNRHTEANDGVLYHYTNENMFDSIVYNLIAPGDRPPEGAASDSTFPNIAFVIWNGGGSPYNTLFKRAAARIISIAPRESANAKAIVKNDADFLILGDFIAQDIIDILLDFQP